MFGPFDARSKAQSIPGIVVIAILMAISLLYLTVTMQRSIIVYDEGLILFGAERVLHGDIPHRDFYANYGPAQFYLLAGLYKVFGASVLVERALDTLERCACVAMVFILADAVAPRVHAILAATASLIWLRYFEGYGWPLFPGFAAALAGLALLMMTVRGTVSKLGLFAAGACVGVMALFRYEVGAGIFAFECALLLVIPVFARTDRLFAVGDGCDSSSARRSGGCEIPVVDGYVEQRPFHRRTAAMFGLGGLSHSNRTRIIATRLLMFGLGFSAVTVPLAAALAYYGVIPDLIFDIVTSVRNYARMRSMPFPGQTLLISNPAELGVYLPLIVCLAAVPTVVALVRHRVVNAGQAVSAATVSLWTLLVLIAMTLMFYSKGLVHVSAAYMSMSLITSLIVAAVLVRLAPASGRVNRGIIGTVVLMLGAVTLYTVPASLHQALWNIEWALDPVSRQAAASDVAPAQGSCRMPVGLERADCFRIRPDTVETVRYIKQRTAPDDPVFVGLSAHDKMLGNDNLIYFLLDRPSATKWHHFDPGLQTSAPIQSLMIKELRTVKPRLIVLEQWGELTDLNDSSRSSGVTLLDDYIRQAYEPIAVFGRNTILRARTS